MLKLTCRPSRLWVVGIVVGLAGLLLAAPGAKPKAPPAAEPPATAPAPSAPSGGAKAFTVKRSDFRVTIAITDAATATAVIGEISRMVLLRDIRG